MSRKIKFHTFQFLFRLFAYLADKTGGWRVFVLPKLLLGSLIVGLGWTSCNKKADNQQTSSNRAKNSDSTELVSDYKNDIKDSAKSETRKQSKNNHSVIHFKKPMITCYDMEVIIKDTVEISKVSSESSKDSAQVAFCYAIDDIQGEDIVDRLASLHQTANPDKIYEVVDQMPEFPEGVDSLLTYISKKLKWPNTDSDVQGKVICIFVVNTDGSISDIEVIRSLDPLFDAEAVRVIKILPKFIPGKQNGQVVRAYYTLPITFRLE